MPEKRRRSIARIAERYGVYVIEDDVYGPLLEKRPPPISSFLPDLGFYCTSFTKSVMAGLRTGYLSTQTRFALRVNGILRVNSWLATPLLAEDATRWIEDGSAASRFRVKLDGVYVIEDDVYVPLLEKRPPPISSFLPDLGFYCTSFTKSVMAGLRTGYLSTPTRFALRVNGILRVNSWMATPLLAEVATRWIEDGTAARLIRVQRECLARRHAMVDELLGEYVIIHHPNGLSAWIGMPAHWRMDSLVGVLRSEEHTSALQSLMRISYAVFCLKTKKTP